MDGQRVRKLSFKVERNLGGRPVFPSSSEAPRANYYKARVHLELGQYERAYIEFEVLKAMYPGTEHAGQAHSYAGALRLHHGEHFDMDSAEEELARLQQTRLANDLDPSEQWQVADGSAIDALFTLQVAEASPEADEQEETQRLSQLFPGE